MKSSPFSFLRNAPIFLFGAFFLLSCKAETPDSLESPNAPPTAESGNPSDLPPPTIPETQPPSPTADPSPAVRFMAYNVKNYLTMEVVVKGGETENRPKDPDEIKNLIDIIVAQKPHILGICEIGTPEDLADLQHRLKDAGLDLPHSLHTGGWDNVRHLALLSAFPISQNLSQRDLTFKLDGTEYQHRRGILHALIDLPSGPTHFIGAHLKSKRPSNEYDEAEVRLNEAILTRQHCEKILAADPNARLVLYGDMNDTRKTPPLATLMGQFNSPTYLSDVFLKDSRGDLWTHYWAYQQQYSRIDWVLVSQALKDSVDMENSHLVDPPNWFQASDHRPLLVTFSQ